MRETGNSILEASNPFFNKMEVLQKPGIHFGKIGYSFRETEYLYFSDYDIVVFYYFTKLEEYLRQR